MGCVDGVGRTRATIELKCFMSGAAPYPKIVENFHSCVARNFGRLRWPCDCSSDMTALSFSPKKQFLGKAQSSLRDLPQKAEITWYTSIVAYVVA